MKVNGKTIGIVAVIVMVLQLLLISMKECGFIDWAWGWVLAPLWMTATTYIVEFVVFVFVPWLKERLHGKD